MQIEIVGRLNALGEKAYPNGVKGVWGKMVAEVRYTPNPDSASPLFAPVLGIATEQGDKSGLQTLSHASRARKAFIAKKAARSRWKA